MLMASHSPLQSFHKYRASPRNLHHHAELLLLNVAIAIRIQGLKRAIGLLPDVLLSTGAAPLVMGTRGVTQPLATQTKVMERSCHSCHSPLVTNKPAQCCSTPWG